MARRTPAPSRGQRADAFRNMCAILDAAEAYLCRDADATVAGIARCAGVGRVTLYGHFPTRADLVEAVFARIGARAEEALGSVDTGGDPRRALADLVRASWRVAERHRRLRAAAERELPPARVRRRRDRHVELLTDLARRGRNEGCFRDDAPVGWLVTVAFTLMQAAATEEDAGRLSARQAEDVLVRTILATWVPSTDAGS
jgi:AcrR family transcriptional regulator